VPLNSKDVAGRGPCPCEFRSTFQISKRSGFYSRPAVDTAGSNVVSQAGGLLLTETIRTAIEGGDTTVA
jgi:hypothetical protein